jgi:hypothetical protein
LPIFCYALPLTTVLRLKNGRMISTSILIFNFSSSSDFDNLRSFPHYILHVTKNTTLPPPMKNLWYCTVLTLVTR